VSGDRKLMFPQCHLVFFQFVTHFKREKKDETECSITKKIVFKYLLNYRLASLFIVFRSLISCYLWIFALRRKKMCDMSFYMCNFYWTSETSEVDLLFAILCIEGIRYEQGDFPFAVLFSFAVDHL
jgi:hypothetical protein